jgi:hypothetical protein
MKDLIKLVLDRKSEINLVGYFLFLGYDGICLTLVDASRHTVDIFVIMCSLAL